MAIFEWIEMLATTGTAPSHLGIERPQPDRLRTEAHSLTLMPRLISTPELVRETWGDGS